MSAADWAYQGPNLLLAAMMYTLLGRFVLSLFFPPQSDKTIWRVFCQITDPLLAIIGRFTPALVPPRLLVLFAFVWLLMLRLALLFIYASMGWLPKVGG